MADKLTEELTKILRDRDIPFDRDAFKSALQDPERQTAIREWMEEYLAPECLLTKDELAMYSTLTKSEDADIIAAQDLSAVQGLNEAEIRNAIEELRRSTAAIENQSEALKLQHNAMSALVKNSQRTSQARSQATNTQHKKWHAEIVHVSRAVEDLSQNLTYQMADLEQQAKVSEGTVKQTVDSILRSDDKLLESLQKLASDLDPIQSNDEETMARVRELSARLIKYTVEGVRTKLDRIYSEALHPSESSGDDDSQEVHELQEELESLYSEILPVAQMSAEQQFLQPALRTVAATTGQIQKRAARAVEYIHKCLTFLVNRLELFLERAQEDQCHKMTLRAVLESAKQEISRVEKIAAISTAASPAKPNTQRRRTSSAASTSRMKVNRRHSSGVELEDVDPEQQIARILGVTLPEESLSDHDRSQALEKVLADRLTKLDIHATNLQTTTQSSIATHLLDSQLTLQLLQDSLLAETLYHKVRLLDPDIESSVSMFEQEIDDLQADLGGLDLQPLQARNVDREQFLARWSH
ncbi:hypothetical protein BJ875DRAFT_377471 [Amylocarpus encephaloides]|uniref:HAUS augmin-like complex subunit 3 N-terminal domain-containing protein n=1 Tax=Amylocarpus encephaloides TaxID=45428 RepID=A0A9P7YI07_9HELO|nr:hypothetical protein BJ875DRAFT_377471 [Amylocarpus encephaloides]